MKIRASSMPLACLCPASTAPGMKIDFADEVGTTGSEIHRAIAMRLQGETYPEMDPESEEMVELGFVWATQRVAEDRTFGHAYEVRFEDEFGGGTLDVFSVNDAGDKAWIADWKTAFRDNDYWPQAYRYAHLAFKKYPKLKEISLYIVWLRKEGVDFKVVTRAWIDAWWDEFVKNTLNHPEVYRVGGHCDRCPHRVECPALAASQRQFAMILADAPNKLTKSREAMARFRPNAQLLMDVLKFYFKTMSDDVKKNGPIDMGDGKELRAIPTRPETINFVPAFPVLQKNFTDDEIATFTDVGKTKMLELIGSKSARGSKTKSQNALMEKLKAAGAVSVGSGFQVREVAIRERV